LGQYFGLVVVFPALQSRLQQRLAVAEVPIKAALGHAQAPRQGLDRQRPDAFLGNHLEGAVLPVFGGQAGAFGFAWRVHSSDGSAMRSSGHRAAPAGPAPRRELTAPRGKTILMRMVTQRHKSD